MSDQETEQAPQKDESSVMELIGKALDALHQAVGLGNHSDQVQAAVDQLAPQQETEQQGSDAVPAPEPGPTPSVPPENTETFVPPTEHPVVEESQG